jgi:hypothetical protein
MGIIDTYTVVMDQPIHPIRPGSGVGAKIMTIFSRDAYGQLVVDYSPSDDQQKTVDAARKLVAMAASRGKLPSAYDDIAWDKKGRANGNALRHEIYDISPDTNRVLVCVRESEGSKYGVRTTSKTYFVVAKHGRGVRVLAANKAVAAKAAKSAKTLGDAILVALGKMKCPIKRGAVRIGYKLLKRNGEHFASVWDGSEWKLGVSRIESATADHTGGYYYYATLDECLQAAACNDVFGDARRHNQLAIVEVEASGNHYGHESEAGLKLCATKIKPIREIASTL